MTQKFVLLLDGPTSEQQNSVTQYLSDADDLMYWHWFSHSWLIIDRSDTWTARKLRDKVQELTPRVPTLVLKTDQTTRWAAYGSKSMFKWLHKNWAQRT